jgi:hypothetical protein
MSETATKLAQEFGALVNMTADDLERWLRTPASRSVGWKGRTGELRESIGHASGRRIVKILRTPAAQLDADDLAHMRKTIAFIKRHLAQRPDNIVTSRWRYSLMNWGHDPLRTLCGFGEGAI